MRKALLLTLALAASAAAFGSMPRAEAATDCYWYCTCENGMNVVKCSCGTAQRCPWPPPPIACPTCDLV